VTSYGMNLEENLNKIEHEEFHEIPTEVKEEKKDSNESKLLKDKGWNKNIILLSACILVAALLISGSLLYSGKSFSFANLFKSKSTTNKAATLIDDDLVLGNSKAKVTIVDFSDYQCPFCRKFWIDTFPQLKKDYIDTGKVKFVYRDYTLSFHPAAIPSAIATECAREQDKFWELADLIYKEQEKKGTATISYTVADIKKWAGTLGMDMTKFNTCLDSEKYKAEVAKDTADGIKESVSGTPTFFINDKQIVGAYPYAEFQKIIDAALQ